MLTVHHMELASAVNMHAANKAANRPSWYVGLGEMFTMTAQSNKQL